ncbi:MAG: epimerase [Marmoricola sp.]|nr:epimerase [Marmoricola sp.]
MTSPAETAGSSTCPVTWVVGSSGLLGSAVRRAADLSEGDVVVGRVPWTDTEAAIEALLATAEQLPADGWRLVWCAGAGVVATTPEHFERELAVVRGFLERWQPARGGDQALFVASSAGGVYAGSASPPFSELTEPVPISPYGEAKLASEGIFTTFAERTGIPLVVGRISNLYGPGQNLAKGQGLISMLCKAQVTGDPLNVFVSMDTIRDYLYADDAAAMVLAALEAVAAAGGVHVKILASGRSLTIAGVIGEIRKVTRRRPPVVAASSAAARFQTSDLRMHSVSWPPLQQFARTSVSVGIAASLAAVEASLRCPQEALSREGSA